MEKGFELIPLSKIAEEKVFGRGDRFRLYKIGLNVKDPKDDYYEYMLAVNPSDSKYMLLTCVEGYKSGSALALVKCNESSHHVNCNALKFSMGVDNTYFKKEK